MSDCKVFPPGVCFSQHLTDTIYRLHHDYELLRNYVDRQLGCSHCQNNFIGLPHFQRLTTIIDCCVHEKYNDKKFNNRFFDCCLASVISSLKLLLIVYLVCLFWSFFTFVINEQAYENIKKGQESRSTRQSSDFKNRRWQVQSYNGWDWH